MSHQESAFKTNLCDKIVIICGLLLSEILMIMTFMSEKNLWHTL